jgi:hypothetical protein
MSDIVFPNRFYVYALYRNDIPFYIGKGCNQRMDMHESCARNKTTCKHLTCRVIRKAWRTGEIITKAKLYENLTEEEAHGLEQETIALGHSVDWPLVNLTVGGEGASGYKWTSEQREMRRQIVLQEMEEQKERYERFKYANSGRVMSEDERKKRSESVRQGWSDPDLLEKQKEHGERLWNDAEYRAKHQASMHTPEVHEKLAYWKGKASPKTATYPGFIGPDGTVYENVHNLTHFCEQQGLQKSNMCLVAAGKQYEHKGWKRYPPIEQPQKRISPPKTPYTGFISPDGQLYTPTNLRTFCIEHDLQPSAMSLLNSGKLAQYKGWTKAKP